MRAHLPFALAAVAASLSVVDAAAAQVWFGRDNRTYTPATTTWSTQNANGLAASTGFLGAGLVNGGTGFEGITRGPCAMVGAIGTCASGAALAGLGIAPGTTMTVTGDARTGAWGPVVTAQNFTYRDPVAPGYGTAGGPVRRDVDFGHYGVTSTGLQDPAGQYLRLTSLAGAPTTATLSFSTMLTGIGFWGVDGNQPVSTITISGFRGTNQVFSYILDPKDYDIAWDVNGRAANTTSGNAFFFGYRGPLAFDRVTITTNSGAGIDGWSLDNVAVSTVPEPATVALLATGLLGLAGVGAARRRRQGRG